MPHIQDKFRLVLTLVTVDGRTGTQNLHDDSDMVWDDPDGDGETEYALLQLFDEDGSEVDDYQIPGDDWRTIENNGEIPYLWFWVRRGLGLGTAIEACEAGYDPDGYNHEYEQSIDDYIAEVDTLKAALRTLLEAHPLPDDLRRVPDAIIQAHEQAEKLLS